jgi:O-antigen/teichoic acid export membrane protein
VPLTTLLSRLGVHRREHVSVARDFSIYSAVNIVSLVLLLSTGLVLRRYLGLTLAGIWTGLEVLPAYAAYVHFGILNAAERELPFLLGARRADDFDRLKHTLLWLSHGLGALLAIGLTVAALALRSRVERPFFVGLLVYAPLLWTQILATYYLLLFRARQRFVELSGRQALANLLKAMLTVAGGFAFGLYGVFVALLAASTIQLVLFHHALGEKFERHFDGSLLGPLLVDGMPMLAGAVAFETIRNTDRIVIGSVLGFKALGVYSVTQIVCQGLYYLPNALSTVMYPRFQARYGETGSAMSLRKFVEVPLHVLADALLAATTVLLVALPPAIRTWLPAFVDTIPPLRVMLVGTYFLCLTPPAGQFLLTVRKQTPALFVALPATVLTLAAGYVGVAYGLVGVAVGVAGGCFIEFVGINAYAFTHFSGARTIIGQLLGIVATAALWLGATFLVERFVPAGPSLIAVVGGWRLIVAGLLSLPLLVRAARRIRALQTPDSIDNVRAGH